MGLSVWNITFILSAFIVGTAAKLCSYAGIDYYCIFGCCTDLFPGKCCFDNWDGICIICLVLVFILSIIVSCIHRVRVRLNRQCATTSTCYGQNFETAPQCTPKFMPVIDEAKKTPCPPHMHACISLTQIHCDLAAAAGTCYGGVVPLYCMFGCCRDPFYIYCCLSNGAGIGIIIGCIVVILSIIIICLRRRRLIIARQAAVCHSTVATVPAAAPTAPSANMRMHQAPPPQYKY